MFDTTSSRDMRQVLDNFRRSVDQIFSDFYAPATASVNTADATFSPTVESFWNGSELFLRAIVPAVREKDLNVSVQNNQLVIEGERKVPEGWGDTAWTRLPYGKFRAAVTLPNGLDVDKVHCRLHDGVLDISVPVSEHMKPRQIQVESGEPQAKAISA